MLSKQELLYRDTMRVSLKFELQESAIHEIAMVFPIGSGKLFTVTKEIYQSHGLEIEASAEYGGNAQGDAASHGANAIIPVFNQFQFVREPSFFMISSPGTFNTRPLNTESVAVVVLGERQNGTPQSFVAPIRETNYLIGPATFPENSTLYMRFENLDGGDGWVYANFEVEETPANYPRP